MVLKKLKPNENVELIPPNVNFRIKLQNKKSIWDKTDQKTPISVEFELKKCLNVRHIFFLVKLHLHRFHCNVNKIKLLLTLWGSPASLSLRPRVFNKFVRLKCL